MRVDDLKPSLPRSFSTETTRCRVISAAISTIFGYAQTIFPPMITFSGAKEFKTPVRPMPSIRAESSKIRQVRSSPSRRAFNTTGSVIDSTSSG